MRIVVLGLSITSSWGNGHATTYRGLVRALAARGHEVLFLERDVPWYASHRDLPRPPYGRTVLYDGLDALIERHERAVRRADLVVVGSFVPDGIAVAEWVTATAECTTAFYDIDTPITLARVEAGDCAYLSADLVPRFDLYLSFTGGPILRRLEDSFGARRAVPLYCAVDPAEHAPLEDAGQALWDLGYMGTYSADRQPTLERLLLDPARRRPRLRFVVAGPSYPEGTTWPPNVERIEHLPPRDHRLFYAHQRFTLNVTRADMIAAGYAPSVRLFEAAACGVPVISDAWPGIDTFFEPGREILLAESSEDCLRHLRDVRAGARRAMGEAARARVLAAHTADHRAVELEGYVTEAIPA